MQHWHKEGSETKEIDILNGFVGTYLWLKLYEEIVINTLGGDLMLSKVAAL